MADVSFVSLLNVAILAVFALCCRCKTRYQRDDFKYLNYPSGSVFNFILALKRPICRVDLARVRGAAGVKPEHVLPKRKFMVKFLCSILIMCGDVQLNPGPCRFPCDVCTKPAKSNEEQYNVTYATLGIIFAA